MKDEARQVELYLCKDVTVYISTAEKQNQEAKERKLERMKERNKKTVRNNHLQPTEP